MKSNVKPKKTRMGFKDLHKKLDNLNNQISKKESAFFKLTKEKEEAMSRAL